jgi:hypothetical protein
MTVFYVVESMQRDREVRIKPVLWAKPTPNSVLLLSKFLATFLLMLSVIAIATLTAIAIQLLRGHAPVELYPYLVTYSVIVIPSVVFMAAVSILLNVVLRDKYLAYVVIVGVGAVLFYLYSQGYNHWLLQSRPLSTVELFRLNGSGKRTNPDAENLLAGAFRFLSGPRPPWSPAQVSERRYTLAMAVTVVSFVLAVMTGSLIL